MCGDVEKWQKSKHIVRYNLLEYKKIKILFQQTVLIALFQQRNIMF